jgi:uridylate kinase
MNQTLVISLGGSLIVPDGIDTVFLKKFKAIIERFSKRHRVIIICGGGNTARRYNSALRRLRPSIANVELDLMGIEVTHVNALLLRGVFGNLAEPTILHDPTKKLVTRKRIIIGCGWKPGCSTDKDAVLAARTHNVQTIINLSNIEYVYDRDPKKFGNAKPYRQMTWKQLRQIVGNTWRAGAHVPFDPVAARLAQKWKLKLVVLKGSNLRNFSNFLQTKKFLGTIIT